MARALIIGGAGLIGSRLSDALMLALLETSEGLPRGQHSQSSDVEADTVASVTIAPQSTHVNIDSSKSLPEGWIGTPHAVRLHVNNPSDLWEA